MEAGDAELLCRCWGASAAESETLVLLHGNGEDGTIFAGMVPRLSQKLRLIAPDTRGHGRSTRGENPLDYRTFSADLLRILDRFGLEQAHLLGFSDGGNTALSFAMAHPGRVKSLTAVGANLSPAGIKPSCQIPIAIGYGMCSCIASLARGWEKARRNRELLALMVKHPHIDPGALRQICCPTLVVAGEKDIIKESETRAIAGGIPGARLEIIKGAGHFIPMKQPDILADLTLDLYRQTDCGR